jgi:CDP-glycerol glycerophosphotransferase
VVVPFYNVEPYLAACLDSIVGQSFQDIEVLLVDDGSPDGSRRIADEYAARDPRLRVVARENGGLGAARNTGIREARGRYLTFVDSDDVLPPHALRKLMHAAHESGSDIVVGAVDRFNSVRHWQSSWVEDVHATGRRGITLTDHLPLLRNLYTWNKVFRRDFWDAQDLWFREGVAYEDQPIITQLLARAASIDVLPDVVYLYRSRDDNSSISQQTASLADLRARIQAWEVSREQLGRELPPALLDAWLGTLFSTHFHWYLTSKGTVDDDYWAELVAAIRDFTDTAPKDVWDQTEPDKRVLIELTRQDRRADAQEFVRQSATNTRKWPSTLHDRGVLLQLPFHDDPDLDDDLFLLRPEQLELAHSVERIAWVEGDDGTVAARLSGWAFVTKVDLTHVDAVTELLLRSERTGEERVFPATERPGSAFPPPVDDVWCDYTPGTFAVEVPLSDVLDGRAAGDVWRAWLRITVGEVTVTRPLTRVLRNSGASVTPAHRLPDGARLVPVWAAHQPLGFRREPAGVEVRDVAVDGHVLTGSVTGDGWAPQDEVVVMGGAERGTGHVDASGHFRVELPTGEVPAPGHPRTCRVRLRRADGALSGLVPPEPLPGLVSRTVPATNRLGELVVVEWSTGAEADEVVVRDDGTLLVRGRVHGDATSLRLLGRGLKANGDGPRVPVTEGRFEAVLELRHDLFRFGRLPLPAGDYDVLAEVWHTESGEPVEVPVRLAASMAGDLPVPVATDVLEGRVVRGAESRLRVLLARPLGPARGRYQQHLLRTTPRPPAPIERCLLVRSYFGEQATDHGLAVHAELRRRGSDLPVYWTVQDHSVPVPEGGIPVIWNSREWFDVLGRAKYYLDNMYQPDYHRKPEGQVIIQTFHGYPFKQMGHAHWAQLQFSQAKIDSYDERAADWDYMVSPARYATEHLVREFRYPGEVLEIGYPRNDALLAPDADAVRATVRASLGLREGQTAVLYAPTFRDYLSPNDKSAVMADFFDFAAAHRALGDDVVFLVRGHAFNARVKKRPAPLPGCVDVTDYPEVSDLLLAADAAVVDYSSLRFDFGVTGKPMVFHVPDLQRYRDTRGWLFDFALTAPGPLVATTDEVVAHLADLDGVRRDHAAAYATFRADYLDLEDGHAARRLVDAVFAPRGDA